MNARSRTKPPSVALVAVPESSGAVLYGLYEVLAAFGDAWAGMMGGSANPAPFEVRIVAPSRAQFNCAGGVPVSPHASLDEISTVDVIIVTDLHVANDVSHDDKWLEVKSWLRQMHSLGSTICSVCSGSVLLAGSGLLDDQPATTHWAFVEHIRRFYPRVKLEPGRVLIPPAEDRRIVTCGGMAAWEDLALYLIAHYYGEGTAANAAKLYLFGDRSEGQLVFAAMTRPRRHEDAVIAGTQQWVAEHYAEPNPVSGMEHNSGLTARSFKRRFKAATGYTPIEYVQTLRVEEAKQILESSSEAIDAVARMVGYEDPTSFRRLFKRRTGVTPGRYRQRFGRSS